MKIIYKSNLDINIKIWNHELQKSVDTVLLAKEFTILNNLKNQAIKENGNCWIRQTDF